MSGSNRPYSGSNPADMNDNIPLPPVHRYSQSTRTNSSVTPGADNLGPSSVGGGISGIAIGVANAHDRQSGANAFRGMENDGFTGPAERGYNTSGADNPYVPPPTGLGSVESLQPRHSYGSNMPLGAAAASPGTHTPAQSSPNLSDPRVSRRSIMDQYPGPFGGGGGGIVSNGPYQRQSAAYSNVDINPEEIADDGDDEFMTPSKKRVSQAAPAAVGAAGGAAAGGFFGGLFGKNKSAAADPSYGPVPGSGLEAGHREKLQKKHVEGRKKRGWIVGIALAFIILAAIVGGAVGGTLGTQKKEANAAAGDENANGDLGKNSPEIQALMNNKDLHKVFPGMDYTPWGVQYPLCLKYPPSQNNVTRDLAVLTQLTNNVRLYGTDCNQTEMVLHAISRLELTDMKVWLGVWIDTNTTTVQRQLNQLYHILDIAKDPSIFNGIIVGNEVLYRAGANIQSAETMLIGHINEVKKQVKKRNLKLPVCTSDLGDSWNAELVQAADVVMSNVHPFFAGVNVDVAASWTWDFWQTHDVVLTQGTNKKQIISEVGWPSAGGKDCGSSPVCDASTPGSVAGIDNMNKFMSEWVCQALNNGTDYFWYVFFFLFISFVSCFVMVFYINLMQVRSLRRAMESHIQHP